MKIRALGSLAALVACLTCAPANASLTPQLLAKKLQEVALEYRRSQPEGPLKKDLLVVGRAAGQTENGFLFDSQWVGEEFILINTDGVAERGKISEATSHLLTLPNGEVTSALSMVGLVGPLNAAGEPTINRRYFTFNVAYALHVPARSSKSLWNEFPAITPEELLNPAVSPKKIRKRLSSLKSAAQANWFPFGQEMFALTERLYNSIYKTIEPPRLELDDQAFQNYTKSFLDTFSVYDGHFRDSYPRGAFWRHASWEFQLKELARIAEGASLQYSRLQIELARKTLKEALRSQLFPFLNVTQSNITALQRSVRVILSFDRTFGSPLGREVILEAYLHAPREWLSAFDEVDPKLKEGTLVPVVPTHGFFARLERWASICKNLLRGR